MKRVVAFTLSLFTIVLLTTSVFAAGFSGGVNGDGSFAGGGFTGGTRVGSSFGSTSPQTSSLSTMLSYEALNNLAANINLGISLGEIEILDGAIRSVTVTKRADWNAYVITGVANGITYVIVNGSGGRYYSPINEGYTISAIAGVSNYYLTDRPVNTSGGDYSGDLALTYSNWSNIKETLNNLRGDQSFYTYGHSINGEFRYYLAYRPNTYTYYVCDSAGRLFYTVKEEAGTGGDGDGSSFDATEVITAINSVYDAIDIGFWDVCNWLEAIQDNISSFNTDVLIMSQNVVNGFTDLHNVGSRINDTLIDINSGLFAVGDEIVYSIDYLRYKFVDYFDSLGQTYSKLVTVELSGEGDTLVWSKGNSVQSVEVSNMSTFGELSFFKGGTLGSSSWSIANRSDGYTTSYNSDTELYDFVCVAPNGYDRYVTYNWVKNGDFSKLSADSTLKSWSMIGGAGTVTVGDGFVNYTVTGSARYNRLYYPLSIDFVEGQTYTISVLCSVNSYDGGYITFRGANGTGQLQCANESVPIPSTSVGAGVFLYTTTFTSDDLYSDARVEFLFSSGKNGSIDIYGVKVERVDYQSLAFEGYDGNWHFYTDVYMPPNLTFTIDGQTRQLSTALSFCENRHDRIFYDAGNERWYVYRYSSGSSYELPTADQKILNNCFPYSGSAGVIKLESINTSSFSLMEDGIYSVDVDGDAVVTVSYIHNGTWFEYMYLMMDKLYERIGQVDGAVVNIENTVVDIVQDNDAFNVFYVEKSDGTTESVGDAATDAAKVVGEFLSIFYRLVFEDALSSADIIHDFEDVYTDNNVGVSVW